tara:strand:+ start:135 stop:413 length:279 start_codon:yes stop_codon:yes gene_type:complete
MKALALATALLLATACSQAEAGHSQGNGTCEDDITHYENMTVNGKRSDAPLYAESQAWYNKAINKHNYWKCEQYIEEALRMIRKTDGEYPTE